ncbi:Premnaspirodiene oxygenase [Dichanthelium oligosanthes]|uniref:Premnaspirodiene oxygenase n=1 Tax=Dichanthelium oligosanthes TaxID=888268 RepID=A0A1E5VV26_9POAL|nr:Premnaspirodiene oxygenase [Dichanthelium oligosanthes]
MAADGRLMEEDDLVDVLLRIQKDGGLNVPLTMGNIKSVIFDLFSAGSETAAPTLQWAMSELMRNPNVMKRAQAELCDILNGKPKVTEDDLIQMKYIKLIIKKGTTMYMNAWAIGRDPKYWEDTEEFKPERFESNRIDFKGTDFEYIPFGSGRRICPGILFAMSTMELTLAALLYHFDWTLTVGMNPAELDMTEEMGLTVRRKNDLYLHSIVRVPLQCTH